MIRSTFLIWFSNLLPRDIFVSRQPFVLFVYVILLIVENNFHWRSKLRHHRYYFPFSGLPIGKLYLSVRHSVISFLVSDTVIKAWIAGNRTPASGSYPSRCTDWAGASKITLCRPRNTFGFTSTKTQWRVCVYFILVFWPPLRVVVCE
jgi:hypothetical protein